MTLPTRDSEFSTSSYWDTFFTTSNTTDGTVLEWYGTFLDDLLPLLPSTPIPTNSKALVLGCGNSSLSEDLYDTKQASQITSIDFSSRVLQEMQDKCKGTPQLIWKFADFTKLPLEFHGQFDVIWDKGALDALLGQNDVHSNELAERMQAQVHLCMNQSLAKHYIVSLLQKHVLVVIINAFWELKYAELSILPFTPKADSALCPFLITLKVNDEMQTKTMLFNGIPVKTNKECAELVENTQAGYRAKRALRMEIKYGFRGTFSVQGSLQEFAFSAHEDRYRLDVVDTHETRVPFAALILPHGRESEWAFTSEEGRMGLATSNGIGRLALISLGRTHIYASGVETIQAELSQTILDLAPPNLPSSFKIPFMAVSQDLGGEEKTTLVATEKTANNKVCFVYQVELLNQNEHSMRRRLVFADESRAVQSECVLDEAGQPNLDVLAFDLHRVICSVAFSINPDLKQGKQEMRGIQPQEKPRVVVGGVGGGGLISYFKSRCGVGHDLSSAHIILQGVEIDPDVLELGRKWFGLKTDITVGDAHDYIIRECKSQDVDLLVLDIDGGSSVTNEEGLFPPPLFLQEEFLSVVRDSCLRRIRGVLVINFGCLSTKLRKQTLARVCGTFTHVACVDMSEVNGDANIILICTSFEIGLDVVKKSLHELKLNEKDDDAALGLCRVVLSKQSGELIELVKVEGVAGSATISAAATKKKNKKNKKR